MSDEAALTELRQEIRDLTARVASLEEASGPGLPGPRTLDAATAAAAAQDDDGLWALTGLRARLEEDPSTAKGAVTLVGAVTLPTGAPVAWQQTEGTAELFEMEWAERATAFAALGHPVRVELLRHVLSGVHATAELASIESLGTTGQLHHHLRQLLSSGWVKQRGRGSYEVPAARIVPLLACLVAVGG